MELTQEQLLEEFYRFVESQSDTTTTVNNKTKLGSLFTLIPKFFQDRVINDIEKKYKGDIEAYKQSIPTFLANFTKKDRDICDNSVYIEDKKERRKQRKDRDQTLLWCSFLLGFVGTKTGEHYIDDNLFGLHQKIMKERELASQRARVINSKGVVSKITSPAKKYQEKKQYISRLSRTLTEIEQNRGFTWAFLTFTLPPHFHPNPSKGKSSYEGATPDEMLNEINKYWQLFRSELARLGLKFGTTEDIFGLQVIEGHKDGTPHRHALIHFDKKHNEVIKEAFKRCCSREIGKIKETKGIDIKLRWDFKENDGRAMSSTYLHKYIFPDNEKKAGDRNVALRYFYGCRAFNYIGVNGGMSTFEFLCSNHQQIPEEEVGTEFYEMLKTRNLHSFLTQYFDCCKKTHQTIIVKDKDGKNQNEKVFLGIEYSAPNSRYFLYRKHQNALIENYIDKTEEIIDISDEELDMGLMDMNVRAEYNWEQISHHYPTAYKKQKRFNLALLSYLNKQFKDSGPSKKYFIPELSETVELINTDFINIQLGKALDISLENDKDNFETYGREEFFKYFTMKPVVKEYEPKNINLLTEEELNFYLGNNDTLVHLNNVIQGKSEKPVPKAPEPWCFEELLE